MVSRQRARRMRKTNSPRIFPLLLGCKARRKCVRLASSFLTLTAFIVYAPRVSADIYYYNNLLQGERAVGMGGAYSAVADDASGVIYNPAGLGFALSSNISASANTYLQKKVTYKKTIGSENFVESSDGFLPSFIGGLKKLDWLWDGLVAGFAIYSSDYEFQDQDNFISQPQLGIESYHRTVNKRASTLHVGIGVGKRFAEGMSVGVGLDVEKVDYLVQQYQDSVLKIDKKMLKLTDAAQAKGDIFTTQTQNIRTKIDAMGVQPIIGAQVVLFNKLSFGLSYKKTFYYSQKMEVNGDQTGAFTYQDKSLVLPGDVQPAEPGTSQARIHERIASGKLFRQTPNATYSSNGEPFAYRLSRPFSTGPAQLRLGSALFATSRLLWTAEIAHNFEVEADPRTDLHRNAVTNYATGMEYYVTSAVPVRFGLFTNNDTRPVPSKGKTNQPDHVNYLGASAYVGWAQPTSQLGTALVIQQGKGKAQKVSGVTDMQDVEGFAWSLLLGTSYTL